MLSTSTKSEFVSQYSFSGGLSLTRRGSSKTWWSSKRFRFRVVFFHDVQSNVLLASPSGQRVIVQPRFRDIAQQTTHKKSDNDISDDVLGRDQSTCEFKVPTSVKRLRSAFTSKTRTEDASARTSGVKASRHAESKASPSTAYQQSVRASCRF